MERAERQKTLLVDPDLCYGCWACEVACKQEHGVSLGPYYMRVMEVGPDWVNGKLALDYVPMACKHCEDPPCIPACSEGAMYKRPDGIVLIDEEKCTGCKLCIEACPFGALQFIAEANVVRMCDLCVERIDQNLGSDPYGKFQLLPACVHHCPTGALSIGEPSKPADPVVPPKLTKEERDLLDKDPIKLSIVLRKKYAEKAAAESRRKRFAAKPA